MVITVVCFLLVLAVPTTAVTVNENPANDDISLEPTSPYATTTDDGQLELDFDALNDRAVSTFDDVFEITVTDDSVERIWLSDAPDGVQFYQDGNAHDRIDETSPLEAAAGETTTVGVTVSTHADPPSSGTFTLHAEYEDEGEDEKSANIELVEMTTVDRAVTAGETLTVQATYENHGDVSGTTVAQLTVDGVVVDEQVVSVGAGETETVTFERTMQQSGTFAVGVDDGEPKTVTAQPPDEPAPDFDVTDADLAADSIAQSESTRVTATVENTGNATGEFLAELAVGGIVVNDRSVELEPNESDTVTFEWQFDEPGTYDVAVSGLEAGTVTVGEPREYEVLNRVFSSPSVAVVGLSGAVGMLFVAGVVRRRWNL
ncbi:hypothetical protein CV102_11070 [Natronococcus pandeyae]|uniref:CARDB domain-containing protein n=1 Tax=Natronococcus pandeyae TaxID=2055836 RepID=A0A8J8TS40_9EURY|nr:hypothetical protein CV102_11070 [Natronococcus pandeyae]